MFPVISLRVATVPRHHARHSWARLVVVKALRFASTPRCGADYLDDDCGDPGSRICAMARGYALRSVVRHNRREVA